MLFLNDNYYNSIDLNLNEYEVNCESIFMNYTPNRPNDIYHLNNNVCIDSICCSFDEIKDFHATEQVYNNLKLEFQKKQNEYLELYSNIVNENKEKSVKNIFVLSKDKSALYSLDTRSTNFGRLVKYTNNEIHLMISNFSLLKMQYTLFCNEDAYSLIEIYENHLSDDSKNMLNRFRGIFFASVLGRIYNFVKFHYNSCNFSNEFGKNTIFALKINNREYFIVYNRDQINYQFNFVGETNIIRVT